ncbi:MAG: PD-(D/E)XK nuclease family protein [Candidatus Cloacimonetes bacterium]|nr:PD-(D/E)XK nuclease family protein [Candidatus Cloacimonadota bacterium]MDY0171622.1 PD-(D/E)XK nuclease family protein [Candidatus Cloacimonadaceae bacterium]
MSVELEEDLVEELKIAVAAQAQEQQERSKKAPLEELSTETPSPEALGASGERDKDGLLENKSPYTLPQGYLSPSQIGMLQRCAYQYYLRYILGIRRPPGYAAVIGISGHAAFEQYYGDKIRKAPLLNEKQLLDLAMVIHDEKILELDVPVSVSERDETAQTLDKLLTSYIPGVAQFIEPKEVEVRLNFLSKCGVPVLGFIDLLRKPYAIEMTAEHVLDYGGLHMGDHKFTGKKWASTKLQNSLQFYLYSMGSGILNVEIHNLVKGSAKKDSSSEKPRKPRAARKKVVELEEGQEALPDLLAPVQDVGSNVRILRHRFDPGEFTHVENIVEDAAKQISAGIFPRCDPEAWCCNPQWCGYWDLCRGKR